MQCCCLVGDASLGLCFGVKIGMSEEKFGCLLGLLQLIDSVALSCV